MNDHSLGFEPLQSLASNPTVLQAHVYPKSLVHDRNVGASATPDSHLRQRTLTDWAQEAARKLAGREALGFPSVHRAAVQTLHRSRTGALIPSLP